MRLKLLTLTCLSLASTGHAATLGADTGIDWNITPAQLTAVCQSSIDTAKAQIMSLESDSKPKTFASGVGAVEVISADLSDATIAATNLSQFAVVKDVRDASNDCSEKIAALNVQLSADPVIYRYAKDAKALPLTPAERQLDKIYIESGLRAGAGLDAKHRAEVTHLLDQLNNLQIAFAKELGDSDATIHITTAEAQSLPADMVKTFTADDTGYIVPVNESTITQFRDNEQLSDVRYRFSVAYNRRGGDANVKRLTEAVALRDQIAKHLGFKSWAAYQLSFKMAKTPKRALDLLMQIDRASLVKARAEIAVLADMKAASGDSNPFASWDYDYFETQLEKTKYSVDQEALRQYFPVDKVVPALLSIYEKLLGVKFEEITPAQSWAPGVTEYDILDVASNQPVGWFYFDLYPRPGKYSHFATFALRVGRTMPDGSYQKPVGAIIGNWPVAAPGKPSLLSHSDVITFFHEFGHLMHASLTKVPFESIAGTNVRNDFVEGPSQMLENWMWQPAILKQVSHNVTTGEPLSDDMIAKMIALKHVSDGYKWSTQAFLGSYDLDLHSSGQKVDPTGLWFDLKPKLTSFPAVPGTIPEASFGHLMAGYDAGYYGYLWSLVFAQDMFTEFEKGGLESPVVGARYRHAILEKGGSEEPDVLLHEFLGRDVSPKAFYDYIGIDPDGK